METTGAVVQPDSALLAIRIVLSVLPGVIFLISAFTGYRANLNRDRFNMIKEALEAKYAEKEAQDKQENNEKAQDSEQIKEPKEN